MKQPPPTPRTISQMLSPAIDQALGIDLFRRVDSLTSQSSVCWRQTPGTPLLNGKTFGPEEKALNDAQLENLLVAVRAARGPKSYALKESARASIRSRARSLLIGLEIPDNEQLKSHEASFSRLTEEFVREARALDPDIPDSFVGQALRNLWIFSSLQILLGYEAGLTPAGMAYSLLYPYTDNYLDSPGVNDCEKTNFAARLHQKLEGYHIGPGSLLEEKVYRLIDIIGEQYRRMSYPGVHESLLAIHQAQMLSISQQRSRIGDGIIPLTMRKGGSSVLADAYLVKGELCPEEFDFAFEYGVVLQLIDDFQDIREDDTRQSRTLFTTAHDQAELEERCSKTFNLVSALGRSRIFGSLHEGESFRHIIEAGCRMLIFEGIASNRPKFRDEYIAPIEERCPVSFSLLARLKSRMPA